MNASDILKRITKAKKSQVSLLRYIEEQDDSLGLKIRWCGSWLYFREWIKSGESRLMNANFCKKHLLCKACAVRRAAKLYEAYLPKIQSVVDQHQGKLVPAMITLTTKNGPDLIERLHHFKSAWSSMLAAKRKASKGSDRHTPIEWNKVLGSLRAIEVTVSKNQEWHVHAHIFVLLTDYIDQPSLSSQWERFTGDSYVVDVRKCRNGIEPGLLEVLKYSCKFSSMTNPQVYEVHSKFRGTRLVDPQGLFRGVPEPDIDSDDSSDMTGPYRDFIARWVASQRGYTLDFLPEVTGQLPKPPKSRPKPIPSGAPTVYKPEFSHLNQRCNDNIRSNSITSKSNPTDAKRN